MISNIISNAPGWRDKVAALAERRAVTTHAAAVTAANTERPRLVRTQHVINQPAPKTGILQNTYIIKQVFSREPAVANIF